MKRFALALLVVTFSGASGALAQKPVVTPPAAPAGPPPPAPNAPAPAAPATPEAAPATNYKFDDSAVAGQQVMPEEPAPAPAIAPATPTPPSSWIPDAYAKAHRAIVRVENARATATGFLVGDASHVATAYHTVKSGRSTSVITVDGTEIDARITSIDKENDIAILTLARPVPNATALPVRDTTIRIGEPVFIVGHPLPPEEDRMHGTSRSLTGLLDWSMSAGVVGAVGETQIQIDAAVNNGNAGGPVIGADGQVVGVVTGKLMGGMPIEGLGFATRADALTALRKKDSAAGGHNAYSGQVSVGLGGGISVFSGPWGTGAGPTASLSFTFFDLFGLRGHLTLGWGDDNYYGVNVVDRNFFRVAWDAVLEYRIGTRIGGMPFLASIGGGVGMVLDDTTDEVATGTVDVKNCANTAACTVDLAINTKDSDRDQVYLVLTSAISDALRFTFMIDPSEGNNYVAQLTLGYGI